MRGLKDFDNVFGLRTPTDNARKGVDWILVDVDGDGSFSAGADIAIALTGLARMGVVGGTVYRVRYSG